MPRAAVLSIHARVEGCGPDTWDDPSLAQVWGPRYNVYVVAARDLAVFTLGRLPDDGKIRRRADELRSAPPRASRRGANEIRRRGAGARSAREHAPLRGPDGHARDPVGRGAATDGVDGAGAGHRAGGGDARARAPVSACLRAGDARGFSKWASLAARKAVTAFDDLGAELIPVDTGGRCTDASSRRADHPRGCGACSSRSTPAERRRLHAGHHERGPGAARAGRRATRRALDAARVARRAARRRQGRRHVAPRRSAR